MKTNRTRFSRLLPVLFGTVLVSALSILAFSAGEREAALAFFLSTSPLIIALSDYSNRRKPTRLLNDDILEDATFRYAQKNQPKSSVNRSAPALTESF